MRVYGGTDNQAAGSYHLRLTVQIVDTRKPKGIMHYHPWLRLGNALGRGESFVADPHVQVTEGGQQPDHSRLKSSKIQSRAGRDRRGSTMLLGVWQRSVADRAAALAKTRPLRKTKATMLRTRT